MLVIRRLSRLTRLFFHLLVGIIQTLWLVMRGFQAKDPEYRDRKQQWLAGVVRIIGGDVQVQGTPAQAANLYVANHISWLDIPVIGGYAQVDFLSKSEVRQWPLIGWLADRSGTLFIQRGNKNAAQQTSDVIAERLRQGQNVLVFPEGTTSNGQQLRPFHARLFAGAIEADADIQPVALQYLTPQGQIHPTVPYIDQQNMLTNLWGLLAEPTIRIELHFLDNFPSYEQARKTLAQRSETAIQTTLFPNVNPELSTSVVGETTLVTH